MADRILRATNSVAPIRLVLVDATDAANAIAKAHGAQGQARAWLGETLVAALLLASRLKGPGTVQLRFSFTGDLSQIAADATPMGLVRAMIPASELAKIKGFEPMVLPRIIAVRKRDAEGDLLGESMVEMTSTKLEFAMNEYLAQSEQVTAAVHLFSCLNPEGDSLIGCGGFLVEAFPDADTRTRSSILERASILSMASPSILELPPLEKWLHHWVEQGETQVHQTFSVTPYCPCSRDGVLKALYSLGRDELESLLLAPEETELHCDFCRTRYEITREELLRLLQKAEAAEAEGDSENPG